MHSLLTCPILAEKLKKQGKMPAASDMFIDPVTTPKGYTYEHNELLDYLNTHDNRTPLGEKITDPSKQLVTNLTIKNIAERFRATSKIPESELEDFISCELFADNVLLSPHGHSYQSISLESWLKKNSICPLTAEPLTRSQCRPNLLVGNICVYYQANKTVFELEDTETTLPKFPGGQTGTENTVSENIVLRQAANTLKNVINHFSQLPEPNKTQQQITITEALSDLYNHLYQLSQDSNDLAPLSKVINALGLYHQFYLEKNYSKTLSQLGISQDEILETAFTAFQCLKNLIETNKEKIDQLEPSSKGRANRYVIKCEQFIEKISFRLQMLDVNSPILFAALKHTDQLTKVLISKNESNLYVDLFAKDGKGKQVYDEAKRFVLSLRKTSNHISFCACDQDEEKIRITLNNQYKYVLMGLNHQISCLNSDDIEYLDPDGELRQIYKNSHFRCAWENPPEPTKKEGKEEEKKEGNSIPTFFSNPRPTKNFPLKDKIKIVVVGDGSVGKTSLLFIHVEGRFPAERIPRSTDEHERKETHDGQTVGITLFDTPGHEMYDGHRPLRYPNTDVFIICYAINNRRSFENVRTKWKPELHHHCADTPLILVGLKNDLRHNPESNCLLDNGQPKVVAPEEGTNMAREIGADQHIVASSLTNENVTKIFNQAILVAFEHYSRRQSQQNARTTTPATPKCSIM